MRKSTSDPVMLESGLRVRARGTALMGTIERFQADPEGTGDILAVIQWDNGARTAPAIDSGKFTPFNAELVGD